jgi:hypothetical protein
MRITIRRFSRLFLAVIVALSMLHAGQASAVVLNSSADVDKHKKLADYFYSRQMFEVMYRLGVEQDRKFGLQQGCASRYNVKPIGMALVSPIDFPEKRQNPVKGAWTFRYTLTRCGEEKAYNVMFYADEAGGTPLARSYYPGTSAANPKLIYDTMPMAMSTARFRSGSKEARDIEVFDMRIDEPPHDVEENGKVFKKVWSEVWTFKVSGKPVEVPIQFIPDADGRGTTFSIRVK